MRLPHRILPGVTAISVVVTLASLAPPAISARAATTETRRRALESIVTRGPPAWVERIDELVEGKAVSVRVETGDRLLYHSKDWVARPPASNEKLLLSMTLLDRLGPKTTFPLRLRAEHEPKTGATVVRGNVWLIGSGDPGIGRSQLRTLARRLHDSGIRRITGRVLGSTGPFARDHWAPGWRSNFPRVYVALPTALTFRGNVDHRGRHVDNPERRAAAVLTEELRGAGVRVRKPPKAGQPSTSLTTVATVRRAPLATIMRRMNAVSRNFFAEVLGKTLGALVVGKPGTIAKGGKAIQDFAQAQGVEVTAHDSSGLSYANRVTAAGIVSLLAHAEDQPWGSVLRGTLPRGGVGTLEDRFSNVRVRAKTGTLTQVSALSGWVWLKRANTWARFSILSQGMSKSDSVGIEDAIVRIVARRGAPR